MNYWKQLTHVMSYFPEESFRGNERLPNTFMKGFLEVRDFVFCSSLVTSRRNAVQY